ncbi:polysaccharide deacetylase family protein [Rhizobium alvei]|uniref:Polysaccharide deacetylase n=1 Tax=Rhizobium alvei TaxID=1132659 RepID=A0ABT8YKT1_9HYPH|nr:polysaccharide deacetylase [Rhizobium alvei]MDO6964324.1 polysaccharide deacetylase [Rhizobium alvei]
MRFSIVAAALLAALPSFASSEPKPKQLVLISFDGAHDNRLWDRSRSMAARTGARFTYFLSCTYLVKPADRKQYQAPHEKAGRSATGWALSEHEVQVRLGNLWQAHLEGHEIGSHACGHFDGKDWSRADWSSEFDAFDRVLAGAWKANGVGDREPDGWQDFVRDDIKGFRAPYLSTGKNLLPALKAHGFRYDASSVSKGPAYPAREDGITRFALPRIAEGPEGRLIIGMDYNLFIRHSGGLNAPGRAETFSARTLAAFEKAFDEQYHGNRIPLQLGFHFVEMNGGAYWDALEKFVADVCVRPDVACVTYSEAMTQAEKPDGSAF